MLMTLPHLFTLPVERFSQNLAGAGGGGGGRVGDAAAAPPHPETTPTARGKAELRGLQLRRSEE